jgi:hypothetical protein
MINKLFLDRYIWVLAGFYTTSHIWILFIANAVYWDDWILFKGDYEIVINMFIMQAATLFYLEGYAHVLLLKIGPWIYRVLTFLMMFMAGVFLYDILKKYKEINSEIRFFIVLLFLIFPFYTARVALIDLRYTVCYFLFFYAWYLLFKNRFASMILFFMSFNTQSLLVFYILPMIELLIFHKGFLSYSNFKKFFFKNINFLIIPFIFFALKIFAFPSSGLYLDYNK